MRRPQRSLPPPARPLLVVLVGPTGEPREPAARNRAASKLWRGYWRARSAVERAAARAPTTLQTTVQARGNAARNALVEHYQPLVREMVRRLERRLPRKVDRGDLDTAANVGLMTAIEAFDPARGIPFELYGEHRVRGALLDELRNQDWLPRPWRARLEARRSCIERLRAELRRDPDDEEVAARLGIPVETYRQDYGPMLVDGPQSQIWGEEDTTALEGVADLVREAPHERLTRDELLRLVAEKLTVQEYRLVYLKYWEELSMREIGVLLELSESRVCKIHAHLLDRLRDKLRADQAD